MRGRKINIEMEKVTLRLYKGDKEIINEFFPHLGYNQVVRAMVRNLIKKLTNSLNEQETNTEILDNIEVNLGD